MLGSFISSYALEVVQFLPSAAAHAVLRTYRILLLQLARVVVVGSADKCSIH